MVGAGGGVAIPIRVWERSGFWRASVLISGVAGASAPGASDAGAIPPSNVFERSGLI